MTAHLTQWFSKLSRHLSHQEGVFSAECWALSSADLIQEAYAGA